MSKPKPASYYLEHIRSNPDNPGPPPADGQAANIAEVGLLNPVKLMADPTNPLAPGVALHPQNPVTRTSAKGRSGPS